MIEIPIEKTEACIIFVDLINSSSFSSFIGPTDYAKWIILFQKIFEELATKYFTHKSTISTAGDEGYIFVPKWVFDSKTAVYKAICFAFELKTMVKLMAHNKYLESHDEIIPYGLRLAVGIHHGMVTYTYKSVEKEGKLRSEIDKYIGYNINYDKRIETCSREGRFSNIFVSKDVYEMLIAQKPIFFEPYRLSLKGIEKAIDVYEIQSVFIIDEPMQYLFCEEWLKYFNSENRNTLNQIIKNEYWFRSYHLSVLHQLYETASGISNKEQYKMEFSKELFRYLEINDPIVEFIQSIEYDMHSDLTLSISKLKNVLKKYPEFIYAKIQLLDLLSKLLKKPSNKNSDIVFLVDSTKELLNYFQSHLTEIEKEKLNKIKDEAEKIKDK